MFVLGLALVLSASDPTGVGSAADVAATVTQREAARLRAGVQLAGGVGFGFATSAIAYGPGLSLELGLEFSDRYSLVLRGTGFTTLGNTGWNLGLGFDAILSESVSLGAGLAWGAIWGLDAPSAISVGVPVRVIVGFSARQADQVGRRGPILFAELTPGFAYANGRGFQQIAPANGPPLSLMGSIGFGYLWW